MRVYTAEKEKELKWKSFHYFFTLPLASQRSAHYSNPSHTKKIHQLRNEKNIKTKERESAWELKLECISFQSLFFCYSNSTQHSMMWIFVREMLCCEQKLHTLTQFLLLFSSLTELWCLMIVALAMLKIMKKKTF